MTRRLPVTAGLALALEDEGDLFACAERLAELGDDMALRPLARLLIDILAPLAAMGVIETSPEGRRIDHEALLRFGAGLCGIGEDKLWHATTLAELAARWDGWKLREQLVPRPTPPDAAFLQEMAAHFPDKDGGRQ